MVSSVFVFSLMTSFHHFTSYGGPFDPPAALFTYSCFELGYMLSILLLFTGNHYIIPIICTDLS